MRAAWEARRLWLPFVLAALCLAGTRWAGPEVTWVLVLAAVGFVLDGATLLFSRGGGMGGHRQ